MKYCKDCKHFFQREFGRFIRFEPLCSRYKSPISLVTGELLLCRLPYCDIEREDNWLFARLEGTCGREGRFFEPKEIQP